MRKSYREGIAVSDVDLQVDPGEIFALLGPNGAGKTTVVEILEGHRRRDAGTVHVLGVDPGSGDSAWRARIGIVPQDDSSYPGLTVEQTLRHFAGYYPRPYDPGELIESVGLAGKRGARTHALSGGQRRRLSVALGMIGKPELLFLDEPTTGFDPEARHQFWELIERLSAGGTTILLTTHYLEEAERLADRIGVLVEGRMLDVGTPATIGGRNTGATEVSWNGPDGVKVVHTTTPARTVRDLSERYPDGVPGLQVKQPALEDVYLRMIGAGQ